MTRKLLPLLMISAALAVAVFPLPRTETGAATRVQPARDKAARPDIVQSRIPFPDTRKAETRRYARRHYGLRTHLLESPKVIVQHFTGSLSYRSAYDTFARDVPDIELHELPGLCAHFVIDRRGVIHQLVSLRLICRHTVGLNWTAIGIEHVGVSDGDVVGNRRQLSASLRLTRWLQSRYAIRTLDVIGHNESLSSPYHHERVRSLRRQTHGDFKPATMRTYRRRLERGADPATVGSDAAGRSVRLGRSVQGRWIVAHEIGDGHIHDKVLVFGAVHGNETAGMAIARRLRRAAVPAGLGLWIVDNLNPDGAAEGTRQNARGVDLNRNFSRHWRRIGRRGDQQYSGTRALSEPETRIARRLIRRVQPMVTIWFHQPLALVDRSGGSSEDLRIERRFARLSGLPLRQIQPYPGTATRWQNHGFPGTTAFVVELPRGRLSAAGVKRYASAVLGVAR